MNDVVSNVLVSIISGVSLGIAFAVLVGTLCYFAAVVMDDLVDLKRFHPIRAIRRLWATTRLFGRNRRDPVIRAAEEAKTAIENYRHTKRVRNRDDAERWYAEYKALGGFSEPMLHPVDPPTGPPRMSPEAEQMLIGMGRKRKTTRSDDGGVRVVDQRGNFITRY